MENSGRVSRVSQPRGVKSERQRRSGYEPSDTETEWQESPWNDNHGLDTKLHSGRLRMESDLQRNISPMRLSRRHSARSGFNESTFEKVTSVTPAPSRRRNNSKSPYKPLRDDDNIGLPKPEKRQVSPCKSVIEEHNLDNRTSQKASYNKRSVTAPRLRVREDQQNNYGHKSQRQEMTAPSLSKSSMPLQHKAAPETRSPSVGEINEMIANAKIARGLTYDDPIIHCTESISPGDIFFSRDHTAMGMQNSILPKNGARKSYPSQKPEKTSGQDSVSHPQLKANGKFDHDARGISSGTGLSTSTSTSAEKKAFDEASFIEKAFVVESLRQFWADKYQPGSLNGFNCNKQQAQLLKELVSHSSCPHILFKGPPGSGKRALTMALLREIYGDACRNVSHGLRYFQIQETRPRQVVVPLTSSAHHLELNVSSEANAKYALMGLVKEISSEYAVSPKASMVLLILLAVMVLYAVDKAAENIQHLIKWTMDCHTESCKLILVCDDDASILESVKNRCKIIEVDAPVTHEIMEVLIQIAGKEDFDLSMSFAAKIATKSKNNLRKAIMALEACKAHNYPFVDDQPMPIGWEEVLVELAAEIVAYPSPTRLLLIQESFQKLLAEFVPPKLILQKLVEQFLKRVEGGLKRELYYWHGYYNKRLPTGTSALLKLEEFVAKFMSIYRKSYKNFHYI